jgi:transposase InsO family protein
MPMTCPISPIMGATMTEAMNAMAQNLTEFVDYYNHERPHRSLGLQAPLPHSTATYGEIVVRPVLRGLHHVYQRAA